MAEAWTGSGEVVLVTNVLIIVNVTFVMMTAEGAQPVRDGPGTGACGR
jgi:hypothetical protein